MAETRSGSLLWTPVSTDTEMDKFRKVINKKYALSLENYWDLHKWSVTNCLQFWEEVWHYVGIIHSKPYNEILDVSTPFEDIPKWFEGATLNFTENVLRFRDDRVALYFTGESTEKDEEITFAELYQNVELYTSALKKFGIRCGDIVAGYMSVCPEAVYIILATACIGAIWTSVSLEYGISGVLDRFHQVGPKILFAVNSSVYGGKKMSYLDKLKLIATDLSMLEKIIIVPRREDLSSKDILQVPKSCSLHEFLSYGKDKDGCVSPLEFPQFPFSHPLYIFFTSGTTGLPKGVTHSAGGALIQNLKHLILHRNVSRDDVNLMQSAVGWAAWNIYLLNLCIGSAVILYDGCPFYPHLASIWDLVDRLNVSVLTLYPCYIDKLEKDGVKPRYTHKLEKLHTIISTACVLKSQNIDYIYRDVKKDVYLISGLGATEYYSYIASMNYTLPLHYGEIPSPDLGMAIECWDETGKSVIGERGEMIIAKPFPSVPLYFVNDLNKERYKKIFFKKFPGVWSTGDLYMVNPKTQGLILYGRLDCVLNPEGVRFCSSEIYTVVETFKEVLDSICVSQTNKDGDERVVLFLKISPGHSFSHNLLSKIKQKIEEDFMSYYVPAVILEAEDIPYTLSRKKAELAVKHIIANKEISNISTIANPDSLQKYKNIPELEDFNI